MSPAACRACLCYLAILRTQPCHSAAIKPLAAVDVQVVHYDKTGLILEQFVQLLLSARTLGLVLPVAKAVSRGTNVAFWPKRSVLGLSFVL